MASAEMPARTFFSASMVCRLSGVMSAPAGSGVMVIRTSDALIVDFQFKVAFLSALKNSRRSHAAGIEAVPAAWDQRQHKQRRIIRQG